MLHSRRWAVLLVAALAFTACDDDDNGGGTTPPPDGGGGGPTGPAVPGQRLDITAATLNEAGVPTVTFRATDPNGNPIDIAAEQGTAATTLTTANFAIGQLQPNGDYLSIWENAAIAGKAFSRTSPRTNPPEAQPALATATQASYKTPKLEQLQAQGNGVYVATLDAAKVQGIDRTRTFTVSGWISRTINNVRNQGGGGSDAFNFVPAGTAAEVDQVVTDQACNKCHGVVRAHGVRETVQVCLPCHSPQTVDPESGNNVDFKNMIHRIHNGRGLTGAYEIIGYNQGYFDFSKTAMPQDPRNCDTCHQGEDAALHTSRASFGACISCHDYVRFVDQAGAPTAVCSIARSITLAGETPPNPNAEAIPCVHPAGAPSTSNCTGCHTATGTAISVADVHQAPQELATANYKFEIMNVSNTAVGQAPSVTIRIVNPSNNTAWDIRTAPEFNAALSPPPRVRARLGWMIGGEVVNEGLANAQGAQLSILPTSAAPVVTTFNPDNTITITDPRITVPTGIDTIMIQTEGRARVQELEVPILNAVHFMGVGAGAATARRTVTPTAKCNECHRVVAAHGENRSNDVNSCALCHNPQAVAAPDHTDQPIDLKWMVHMLHAGEIRAERTVYGSENLSAHYPTPRSVAECTSCHEGETYQLPLPYGYGGPTAFPPFDTTFGIGASPTTVVDNFRREAQLAVCTSCHDAVAFGLEDAELPTCVGPNSGPVVGGVATRPCLHSGGAVGFDFDCSTCHNPNSPFSVKAVHNLP